MSLKKRDITIVEINRPTKKDAEQIIKKLNKYLEKNWRTPLEKQSRT